MKFNYRLLIISAAIVTALSAVSQSAKSKATETPDPDESFDYAAYARNQAIYNAVMRDLTTYYVDTIDTDKATRNAIDAMLYDLDPYTEYIPESEQDDLEALNSGEYGGIGSYIMQRKEGGVYVSAPYEGSPAERAGLRAGDRFIAIDGDTVTSWTTERVSARLKGEAHSTVKVTMQRPYVADSIYSVAIMREKIKMTAVPYYGVQHGTIGYIALTTFNGNAYEEVRQALIELKKNPAVKQIVLDLAGNGGGLMESAVQIVGLFVPKGTEVLTTRGRLKQSERTYRTPIEPVDDKIPLAVLIDGGSASASEIVAGALQDIDRAVIIGSRSYGKGLVQTARPVPYNGILKLTTAKYYIPSGRLIQAIDYSRRNDDGSVKRTPDSLTHTFRTLHGREVRDGGGITPDIAVQFDSARSRLLYNLLRENRIFDFATRYRAEHPSIAQPEEFEITDELYADFKRFVVADSLSYDRLTDRALTSLRDAASAEGYLTDSVKAQLDRLEASLKHDTGHDLDVQKKQIIPYLADEIVGRYYYERGRRIQALKVDKALQRAALLFATPGEYEKILRP